MLSPAFTSTIMTDDIVEVKAGESIPTDGIIVQGQTSIDESLVKQVP
jgi:Cu2+-exporting ATPase